MSHQGSVEQTETKDNDTFQPRLNDFAQKFLGDLFEEKQRLSEELPLCSLLIDEATERIYSTGKIPGREFYADVFKQKPLKVTQKVFVPVKQYPKMKKSKRKPWTSNAENNLLELWAQNIDGLRGPRKNVHIYREMAADMNRKGIPVSAEEVASKIKNFTTKYRKIKNLIGPPGDSPSSWVHFGRIHKIIGSFPIHNTNVSVEESVEENFVSSPPYSPTTSSPPLALPSPTPSLLLPLSTPSLQARPSPTASPLSTPSLLARLSPTPSLLARLSPTPSPLPRPSPSYKKSEKIFKFLDEADKEFKSALQLHAKNEKEIIEMNKKMLEIEERKLEVMYSISQDAKRMADSMISFLNKQK